MGIVQRAPNDTPIAVLAASTLRKALRWLRQGRGDDITAFRHVLYQPALSIDPGAPERTVEAFIRVTLEVSCMTARAGCPTFDRIFADRDTFTQDERAQIVQALFQAAAPILEDDRRAAPRRIA
jgi:hypothetical protein